MDAATGNEQDDRDVNVLMRSLDDLIASSKSVFPGRVLLNRKKAHRLVDLIIARLQATSSSEAPTTPAFRRLLESISAFDALADRRNLGLSIWNMWFADVSRKRLEMTADELRQSLAAFADSAAFQR
jgi:hypothetical protein